MNNRSTITNKLQLLEKALDKFKNPDSSLLDLKYASKIVSTVIHHSSGYHKECLEFSRLYKQNYNSQRENLLSKTSAIYHSLLAEKRGL